MSNSVNQISKLIKSSKKGDRKACKQLYNAYKNSLFAICLRYFTDRVEAEDMLQEGFILIFKNIKKFDDSKGSFYSWSSKILINVILGKLRKKKPLVIYSEEIPNIEYEDVDLPIHNLTMKEIVQQIQSLPDGYRRVFNMYVLDGMTHKEIAEHIGISVSTSKTQLMYAKKAMKKKLSKLNIYSYIK